MPHSCRDIIQSCAYGTSTEQNTVEELKKKIWARRHGCDDVLRLFCMPSHCICASEGDCMRINEIFRWDRERERESWNAFVLRRDGNARGTAWWKIYTYTEHRQHRRIERAQFWVVAWIASGCLTPFSFYFNWPDYLCSRKQKTKFKSDNECKTAEAAMESVENAVDIYQNTQLGCVGSIQ